MIPGLHPDRTSDELGVAAELKGVGSRGTVTCHRPHQLSGRDLIMGIGAVCILGAAFFLQA